MKTLLMLILLCCFGWFQSPTLKIISATEQEWRGGRKESGKGINYMFTMLAGESSENLKFEKIYIKEMCFNAVVYHQKSDLSQHSDFKKNDTLILQINRQWLPIEGNLSEQKNYTDEKPKIEMKGEAMIQYTLKGKRYYQVITKIEKLKAEQYQ